MIWDSELGVRERSLISGAGLRPTRQNQSIMPQLRNRIEHSMLMLEKLIQEVHVHKLGKTLRPAIAVAALSAFAAVCLAQQPPAQQPAAGAAQGQQPAQPTKKVKDQGEYDIFNEALKDVSNPAKEIQDLDTWTQKYPDSDYKWDRLHMYMQAYGGTTPPQPAKVVEYGSQLMNQDMKKIFGDDANGQKTTLDVLFRMTTSVPALPGPTPEQIDLGKKAAQELKQQADAFFVPSNKPAAMADAAWT